MHQPANASANYPNGWANTSQSLLSVVLPALCFLAVTFSISYAHCSMVETAMLIQDDDEPTPSQTRQERAYQSALNVLKKHNVEPTVKSMSQFLDSVQPDHVSQLENTKLARSLISQLGHEDYKIRLAAQNRLVRMFQVPPEEIQAAAKSKDPEISWRAKEILKRIKNPNRDDSLAGIIESISIVTTANLFEGMVDSLIDSIPLVSNKTVNDTRAVNALKSAVITVASQANLERFRRDLNANHLEQRLLAISGIMKALGTDGIGELKPLLSDESSKVQMIVVRELANVGDRDVLEKLIELMGAEDITVRAQANHVMRAATGQRFDYLAYAKAEDRAAAIQRWSEWIITEGLAAELRFPLPPIEFEIGRFIMTDYTSGKVVEVDSEGETTWEITVSHPWGVQGLPNGHRVISTYQPSALVEYDETGEEVWRIDDVPGNAMGLHRLDNGNTLVACSSTNRVIEYDPEGDIAWEATLETRCSDVQRLENGNTLVTLIAGGKVVEVDRDGEVIWEISVGTSPLTAERNEDGTTLVSCNAQGKAIEFDRDGETVREFEITTKCTAARLLSNGNIFLTSNQTAKLIEPDGTVIWEVEGFSLCYGANNY